MDDVTKEGLNILVNVIIYIYIFPHVGNIFTQNIYFNLGLELTKIDKQIYVYKVFINTEE